MDTVAQVEVYGKDREQARRATRAALDEIARLDGLWNPYDPESEISLVNRRAGGEPVPVSRDTVAVLQVALEVARQSGGAFDPTVGPLVRAWGFGEKPRLPSPEEIQRARALVSYQEVILDNTRQTVRLARAGMALDLGAIAKGYAVDRAREILRQHGIRSALIVAGGSVYALGSRPGGKPWRVAVQHPRQEQAILGVIPLTEGAVDTSGDYQRYFEEAGIRYHHLFDPRTGYPARLCQSATVTHPLATWADALATAAFVLGPQAAPPVLAGIPGAAALLVDERGQLRTVGNLAWEAAPRGR